MVANVPIRQAAQLLGRAGATSVQPADSTSTGSLDAATGCLAQPATMLAQRLIVCPAAGPHIEWSPGRSDKVDGAACPEDGRLPDASKGAPHIRDVFNRMGFNDREIVALSGGMQSCARSFAPNCCIQRQIGGGAFLCPCR